MSALTEALMSRTGRWLAIRQVVTTLVVVTVALSVNLLDLLGLWAILVYMGITLASTAALEAVRWYCRARWYGRGGHKGVGA